MMQLKPNTEKTLDVWLGLSTWYTNNTTNMDHWYGFVDQYQKEHGFEIDEAALRGIIEHKLTKITGTRFDNEHFRKKIRERISLAYNILDFLRHTGR
jgi:hypothetical protein